MSENTTPSAAPAANVAEPIGAPPSPLRETWDYFRKNRGAYVGLMVIAFILFLALTAQWIAPFDPIAQDRTAFLKPPVWMEGGDPRYLLGTDAVGRDILSRLIHGAQLSVSIGVFVVILSMISGICLGMVAGYFRGWVEVCIMRLMDIMLALPSLIMALAIVAILGPGLENAMLAIAIVQLPHYVRLTRASVVSELNKEYVIASQIAGAGHMRQMFVNILPNCMAPLIVQGTLGISSAILDAAALGFLGLGAQPPLPEWGTMLSEAREFVGSAWWVITFPGLCILVTVLAFNLMGDGLRDALDPKMKR
ncbi:MULTISPECIES: ABC transporter permease subunit [Thalassospira]|jgi:dipeptide transport system permease protein|uniref:ABC transporter permease subunit n=1 Tax=Thalassospira povalilytica TaxID=732237 RepID=A0A8I1MAC0_9PROT|nr:MULTISPECIES: ABC transporter permease subunit [Thalassospira]MEE3046105.1 ABC transporter permease subunit [Pseudomonadota bacterium]RCK20846.1 peptide transporter [Thalassospira profundimaris]KZB69354.1 peptide transporter [Thalassospira sp. MCCC 1A02491]MAL40085.1 dipeptide ABC transporter permease DppC [Thalassospira sp.]MBN8198076.1 ABC transporter permease subunit [Thalassospira povalilytica]